MGQKTYQTLDNFHTATIYPLPFMRLGIFSDVHANIEALTAVLDAFQSHRIDTYYCLGDVVGYGGSPNECADIIRTLTKATILGNHDAAVAGRMDYSYYYPQARYVLDVHAQTVSQTNMEWLKGLPYRHDVKEAGVTLCHGSPVRLEEFDYIFAPEQARECLPIYDELEQLTMIGHSHLCRVFAMKRNNGVEKVLELPARTFQLENDTKYIISVGSVGQPRDWNNRASYCVFDSDSKTFEFHRIEYDIQSAAEKIYALNLPPDFAERLFKGQ